WLFKESLGVLVVGTGLGVFALWQIRNAEGTRAGATLARWALWLSVLFGLGYPAYHVATFFAVTQQPQAFLVAYEEEPADGEGEGQSRKPGFLDLLRRGQVNAAFLLTKPVEDRGLDPVRDAPTLERRFNTPQ